MRGTRSLLRCLTVGALVVVLFTATTPGVNATETNYTPASPPDFDTYLGPIVFATFQAFAAGIFHFSASYGDNGDVLKNEEPRIKNPPQPLYPIKGGESGFIMWYRP